MSLTIVWEAGVWGNNPAKLVTLDLYVRSAISMIIILKPRIRVVYLARKIGIL